MKQTTIGIFGVIIAIVIIFLLVFYVPRLTMESDQPVEHDGTEEEMQDTDTLPVRTIEAMHQFIDGKHIIAGSVDLPTPCHTLREMIVVRESYPEQVTIEFTSATTAEVCIQVITEARFKVEFSASEKATIDATWNGEPATLKLTPAMSNLEQFEVMIKG